MIKKDNKKENTKNHGLDNNLCRLSCYRDIRSFENHDKKLNNDENIVKDKNKHLSLRKSIESKDTLKFSKDSRQQLYDRSSSLSPIQNIKVQYQQSPRLSIRSFNCLNITQKILSLQRILQGSSNIINNKAKQKYEEKIFDDKKCSKIREKRTIITLKTSPHVFHMNLLHHKSCSMYNERHSSPRAIGKQYNNIPISPCGYHRHSSYTYLQPRDISDGYHIERSR